MPDTKTRGILRKSLDEEQQAVKDYVARAAAVTDPGVSKELKRIGADEKEHATSEKKLLKSASFLGALKSLLPSPEVRQAVGQILREPAVVAGIAAPLVGAAVGGAASYRRRLQDAKAKTQSYRTMLEIHPRLRAHDQNEIGRIFNSLHNVNPMLARDPSIAGAWIDNIMENKTNLGDGSSNQALLAAVKDLAGIRSNLSTALRSEHSPNNAGAEAAKAVAGFGNLYSQASKDGIAAYHDAREEKFKKITKDVADRFHAEKQELAAQRAQVQQYAQEAFEKKSELTDLLESLDIP